MMYPSKSVGKFHFLLLVVNLLVSIGLLVSQMDMPLLALHKTLFILAQFSFIMWMIRVHVAVNRYSRDYPVNVGGFILRILPLVHLWGLASTFHHMRKYFARTIPSLGVYSMPDASARFKLYIPLLYIFYLPVLVINEMHDTHYGNMRLMTIGVACSIAMYVVFLLVTYHVNQCLYVMAMQAPTAHDTVRHVAAGGTMASVRSVSAVYGADMRQANRWKRLVAKLIDAVAFTLVILTALILGYVLDAEDSGVYMVSFALLALVGWVFYYAIHLSLNGQTIGKWMMKIRIVKQTTGESGQFMHNYFLRSFVNYLISMFIPFYSLVDVCFIFSSDARCLHDRIAGTVVVKVTDLRRWEDYDDEREKFYGPGTGAMGQAD